ncbi:amidohydrolase [Pseudochrobactrum algeriensis]|uniref:M20 family metallopeptidase n=1 Tax=Pseudochrobactrum algeriensis TaxID=2834768 RepID=UPI001BD0A68A|nr:M20 family metallopeptidase [Pseudochrobactrum algeriensis]QVQ37217.1 amidohydrolase [Pseudochrobactrum algeriensis]QVQ40435.1 amidohydrolase [Pseudochrobactrum algeriensis]QVQ44358.1 amidohydrolase [Pseudochrobactrum algeriensis]
MKNHSDIWDIVEEKSPAYFDLSDTVWDNPETNYEEYKASDAHAQMLMDEGFRVERGIAGLPTAVMGEAGEDGPVIAILGEFDALPGLSQIAGLAEPQEIEHGGHGHGCGHNLLGSGSLLAASALKDYLAENGIKGRVRYYGCPAEEGGSAKGFMVREGLFDDVDVAFCWHPAPFAGVNDPVSLACNEISFHFTGRAAHAASAPHLGRSALDAVELMNVGVNYMREHMPSSARIHYAVTDTGGIAPNVVQAKATVRYLIRALSLPEMQTLLERVRKIAQGAALMTETSVRDEIISGDANLIGNSTLEQLMQIQLERLGAPVFDEQDRKTAREFQDTLSKEDISDAFRRFGVEQQDGLALCEEIYKPYNGDNSLVGSTDVGSVSWVVPTVQMRGATCAIGTPLHSWQMVAQGKLPAAHKGMAHAAKIMSSTAAELFRNPEHITAAKADHKKRLGGTVFINPIPDDVQPALPVQKA